MAQAVEGEVYGLLASSREFTINTIQAVLDLA